MKKVGVLAAALVLLAASEASGQNSRTFLEPRLNGLRVRLCVDSYRYPDGCNDAAKQEAARQFCRWNGYGQAAQWQWWTVPPGRPALKETVMEWTETWRDGSLWTGWTEKGGKRSWFTAIECRN